MSTPTGTSPHHRRWRRRKRGAGGSGGRGLGQGGRGRGAPTTTAHVATAVAPPPPRRSMIESLLELVVSRPADVQQLFDMLNASTTECATVSAVSSRADPTDHILLDSGASTHLSRQVAGANKSHTTRLVDFAGQPSSTSGTGSVVWDLLDGSSDGVSLHLNGVGEKDGIPHDIISVGRLIRAGFQMHLWDVSAMYIAAPDGTRIPIEIRNNVLWVARRPSPMAAVSLDPASDSTSIAQRDMLELLELLETIRDLQELVRTVRVLRELTELVPALRQLRELQPRLARPLQQPSDRASCELQWPDVGANVDMRTLPPDLIVQIQAHGHLEGFTAVPQSRSPDSAAAPTHRRRPATLLGVSASPDTISEVARVIIAPTITNGRSPSDIASQPPASNSVSAAYPVGRVRVPDKDLPGVLHKIALHCSNRRLQFIQKTAPFCRRVPAKYWNLECTCFTCVLANGRKPVVHTRGVRGSPPTEPSLLSPIAKTVHPPLDSPTDPLTVTGYRPFERFALDKVHCRCGKKGILFGLFGADVGSGAYTFDEVPKKRGIAKAFRDLVKSLRMNDLGYMCTVVCDNEPGLVAQLNEVTDTMANVRVQPLISNEPWTNPAEAGWNWLSAAARAILIDSKLGPEFRMKACAHAATHHLFLPQQRFGGLTPIATIMATIRVYDGDPSKVDLVPFGCRAFAVKTHPNLGSLRDEPLDNTARTRPAVVVGYNDRFGSAMTLRVERPEGATTVHVSRRHAQVNPTEFPGLGLATSPQPPLEMAFDLPVDYDDMFEGPCTPTSAPPIVRPLTVPSGVPSADQPPLLSDTDIGTTDLDWAVTMPADTAEPTNADAITDTSFTASSPSYADDPPTPSSRPAEVSTDGATSILSDASTINLDELYGSPTPQQLGIAAVQGIPRISERSAGRRHAGQPPKPYLPNLPQHLARLATILSLLDPLQMLHNLDEHTITALEASLQQPDVQDVVKRFDLAAEASQRPAQKVKFHHDLAYLDLVAEVGACDTHHEVGGSAFHVNNYVPAREYLGAQYMGAAQVDLSWKHVLNSTDRDAAIASLDKEVTDLTDRALTPIPSTHPEYAAAQQGATPARPILGVKRDGRWKTRICVRGDLQDKEALDGPDFVYYTEASQAASVRSLLFRGKRPPGFITGTIDITVAFLQSFPFEPGTPPRYLWFRHPATGERMFYRQRTSIYGECGAPKRWADTLADHLCSSGFVRGENDGAVYFNKELNVSLVVHVDDILFDGPSAGVNQFLTNLRARFDVKDPEILSVDHPIDFLGMIIARDVDNMYLSMEPYVRQSLDVMGFTDLPLVDTPFADLLEGGELLGKADKKRYMMGTGAIGWMTAARVDLSHVHSRLAQHLVNPTTDAMQGLRRAFAYLAQTPTVCLSQPLSAAPDWKFYTDSDFGGNVESANKMRPQLGVLATCGGTPIHFSSKHPKVAFAHRSFTEGHADLGIAGPEIYGLGNGVADFLGLSYIVEELGLPSIALPMRVNVDNMTAVAFSKKTVRRTRLRHIDTRQWWVRAVRDTGLCNVQHLETKLNLADFFTKGLAPREFIKFRDQLMILPPIGLLGSFATFV